MSANDGDYTLAVFVDVGHCDTQVTVVKFGGGMMMVLAHAFDRDVGGRDFDDVIYQYLVKRLWVEHGINVSMNVKASFRLRTACEKAKRALNANAEAPISIECLMDDVDVEEVITRAVFESMSSGLVLRIQSACERALTDAGLLDHQIQSVELVGSASNIPTISEMLKDRFGWNAKRTLDGSESVAKGCALQCAMHCPALDAKTFGVLDIFPFSVAGFTADIKKCPLASDSRFSKGQFLPSTKKIILPPSKLVTVGYADLEELPPDVSRYINRYEFSTDESRDCFVEVRVELNLHGIIKISSASKLAMQADESKWKPIKIFEQPRVASNVLDKAHANETEMEEYDRANEHAKNQRNHLEASLLRMRNEIFAKLKFASKESKNLVLEELDGTEEWLYGLGADESEQAYINRERQLHMVYNHLLQENESSFYQAAKEKEELKSLFNDTWKKLDKGHFHRMQKSERHNLYLRLQETWNIVQSGDLRSKDVYTKEKEALNQLLGSMKAEVETSTTRPQKIFNTISSLVRPGTAPPIDSDKDVIVSQPDNNDMGLGSQQKGASDMAEQKLCNPFPDPTTSATIGRKLAGQEHAGGGHFPQHETPSTSMCIDGDSQQNDGNKIGDEQAGKPNRCPQKVTSATEGGDEMTGQQNANSSSNNSRLDEPSPERNNGQHVGDNRSIPCSNQQQADNHPPSTHNQQLVNPEYSTTTVDNQGAVISNSGGCLGPESGLRNSASSTGAGEEESNPQFDIRLKALYGGRSMTVTCSDGNIKIAELKRFVKWETLRMPKEFCNNMGKVYNDNRTLRWYGITDGSMLYWR